MAESVRPPRCVPVMAKYNGNDRDIPVTKGAFTQLRKRDVAGRKLITPEGGSFGSCSKLLLPEEFRLVTTGTC